MGAEVLAKGPNFVYAREFVLREHGTAVWESVLGRLAEEDRSVWRSTLLVTGAYPFTAFKAMVNALSDERGAMPREETSRMYEFIAERSLSTVHRIFLRVASPAFVIRNYPLLWKRYFNTGSVRVPEAQAGRARLVFELPQVFLDWLAPACLGYSRKAVELAGGHDMTLVERARTHRGEGDWRIEYSLEWREGDDEKPAGG